ncbi:hypothetical protein GH714_003103 [Hevea brasiliensis]|uniref:non-specific serine/threonine protein kinase n=1 Tax=Hevea brasiliensis TaxID=3981 RepID=A0A6A6KKD6_HEVBR|nr:hypothetical protein GH714_003103 [Hevea brasiliensis]
MLSHLQPDYSEFVEVDPTGRYGRYNEILGRGASKTVYRAFDEYEGIEVAWNQVKLYDFLQSPEDLERLYCEIHLLKTLKHKNIMKFYTSWVDTANRNINFVTEMFTSGTLRQYRLKHKRVNIRAVKNWCRQILRGLLYLHSHNPPVIHRDLKCDNIFVNGNQGEVKIGDLGLAAILRKSHAAHCVGTPEFMAPEVYAEAYNELVDIYSFGMCILEMVAFEYPYSECTHPAQIYKKVISGRKPDALYKVKDPEVRQFVEKCLATVSLRLSARELLNDPFLQIDDCESNFRPLDYGPEIDGMGPLIRQPYLEFRDNTYPCSDGYSNGYSYDAQNELEYHPVEFEQSGIELFEYHDDEHYANVDISRIRNIYFPFDVETDTALSVATEMVAELDITDQDVTKIADTIDGEIASLVPDWRPGPGIEETPRFANQTFCHNCASNRTSNGSLIDFLSNNPCCRNGCASMHGRFEEITFQADEPELHSTEDFLHCTVTSQTVMRTKSKELRWLKAKYHIELGKLRDQQLGIVSKSSTSSNRNCKPSNGVLSSAVMNSFQGSTNGDLFKSLGHEKLYGPNLHNDVNNSRPNLDTRRARNCVAMKESPRTSDMVTAKSFYSRSLLPHSLHRTTSLPVDAVDV